MIKINKTEIRDNWVKSSFDGKYHELVETDTGYFLDGTQLADKPNYGENATIKPEHQEEIRSNYKRLEDIRREECEHNWLPVHKDGTMVCTKCGKHQDPVTPKTKPEIEKKDKCEFQDCKSEATLYRYGWSLCLFHFLQVSGVKADKIAFILDTIKDLYMEELRNGIDFLSTKDKEDGEK